MRDQLDSLTTTNAFGSSNTSVADMAKRIAKALGIVWLSCATITWMLCPSPVPMHSSLTAKYADEAGYLIECLSLWPAIAYFTLENPSA